MRRGFPIIVLTMLLGGCAATTSAGVEANATPLGYRYYDSQHPNYVIQPSAEAIANAKRGTYLWPPAMSGVR